MNLLALCPLIFIINVCNGERIGCNLFRYSLQNTASIVTDLNGQIFQYTIFNQLIQYKYQPDTLPLILTNGRTLDINLLLKERIGHSYNYFLNSFGFKNYSEMMKKQFSFYTENNNYIYLIHSIDFVNEAWQYKLYHGGPRLLKTIVLNANYTRDTSKQVLRIILITLNRKNSLYKILARLNDQQIILADLELNKDNFQFKIIKIGQFCSRRLRDGYRFIIQNKDCFLNEDILDEIRFTITINNSIYLVTNKHFSVYVFNQNLLKTSDTYFTAKKFPFSKLFNCPIHVSGLPYTPLNTLHEIIKFMIILAGLLLLIVFGHWTYKCIKKEKDISNYQRFMLFSRISERMASSFSEKSSGSSEKRTPISWPKRKINKKQLNIFPMKKLKAKK